METLSESPDSLDQNQLRVLQIWKISTPESKSYHRNILLFFIWLLTNIMQQNGYNSWSLLMYLSLCLSVSLSLSLAHRTYLLICIISCLLTSCRRSCMEACCRRSRRSPDISGSENSLKDIFFLSISNFRLFSSISFIFVLFVLWLWI